MRNASISSTNSRTSSGTPNMNSSGKHHSNKSSSENIEFLAPINFDDFHNSILDEPSLNNFPLPGHGGAGYESKKAQPRSHNQWSTTEPTTTRTARSNSVRRQSDGRHARRRARAREELGHHRDRLRLDPLSSTARTVRACDR